MFIPKDAKNKVKLPTFSESENESESERTTLAVRDSVTYLMFVNMSEVGVSGRSLAPSHTFLPHILTEVRIQISCTPPIWFTLAHLFSWQSYQHS